MKFLGESPLKKLIALIKGDLANKADKNHTHNYAGSSSAGGAANSANKLNTDAGSATNPVYFKDGVPVKTTYTLGKSVPSDAKFTDTVTEVDATLTAGSTNPVQGGAIKNYIDEKTAGLTGAMHFQGKATVDITDGSTTNPVISGYDFTNKKAKGDVILGKDDNKEYVWTGSVWEELGDEGSYALKTELNTKVSKSGDTMSGDLGLNGYSIRGVGNLLLGNDGPSIYINRDTVNKQLLFLRAIDPGNSSNDVIMRGINTPVQNTDAVNKKYVDDSIPTSLKNPNSLKFTGGSTATYDGSSEVSVAIPTALKNPNALTFTGAVTGTYDGSSAKTVNIPAAVAVDDTVSTTSTNPVQNKVIKTELDNLFNTLQQRIESVNDYAKEISNRIPEATTANNGQFLRVVNGVPTWVALTNVAEEGA